MCTTFKQKIGSHLSYPLKLSDLDNVLSFDVRENEIEVHFSAYKPPRKNETRPSYDLFEVRQSGADEEIWILTIYPVPRPIREAVRQLLLPDLADKIKPWMTAKREAAWYSTYHSLRCKFEVETKLLTFQEHHAA